MQETLPQYSNGASVPCLPSPVNQNGESLELAEHEVGIQRYPYRLSFAKFSTVHITTKGAKLEDNSILDLEERENSVAPTKSVLSLQFQCFSHCYVCIL